MTVLALAAGAVWIASFLALAAYRAIKLRPSYEGPWPWPVWIAIASPVAAALGPLWLFMFAGALHLGHVWWGVLMFAPLLLTAVAGVVGVVVSLFGSTHA